MVIFIIALSVLLIILTIFLAIQLTKFSQVLKEHTQQINELEEQTYKDLRMLQYKSIDIARQSDKYLKGKNSILGEIIATIALTILPFKKLKSIIYLHQLGKKIIR